MAKATWNGTTLAESDATVVAWTYPEAKPAAIEIKDHVAFWRDVEVTA